MIEVLSIIGEVIHDFTGKFLFLGAICAIVFGIWDFSSARRRWRNRRHYSNDYSSFVWPGEKFPGRYSCFFRVIRCLLLVFAAFAATFMTASIAAAALVLTLLGCDLWFCITVFIAMIIVASCTGYFGQYSLDKVENQMIECIEVMSIPRSAHRRLRRVRRPVLSRMRFMR